MKNKVVLITGALTGIGRATALAFAEEGARIVISGRHEEEGQDLVGELGKLGADAEFVPLALSLSVPLEPFTIAGRVCPSSAGSNQLLNSDDGSRAFKGMASRSGCSRVPMSRTESSRTSAWASR